MKSSRCSVALCAFALAAFVVCGSSEAGTRTPPLSQRMAIDSLSEVPVFQVGSVDREALLAEDAAAPAKIGPTRFATLAEVAIIPGEEGVWQELEDGGRLWRMTIESPGATDLNFGFSRFRLPPGATVHVISTENGFYQGPYTARNNRADGELWTAVVPGDRAVIELFVPGDAAFEPVLRLGSVGRGYRGLFDTTSNLAKQGSCNIDVVCPEGDEWREEIRSVGKYTYVSGSSQFSCTGTLLMDVPATFTAYFHSAWHCNVNEDVDQSVVVYWNYESPRCGLLWGGSLADNQSGTTFLATREDADFVLLELDEVPDESWDVYYSGWDARSTTAPQSSVCIHHPLGDEKAISLNDDPLTTISALNLVDPDGNHVGTIIQPWKVDNWEDGTTQEGSSGAGLWDPATHLLVGSLSGGAASCDDPNGSDYFAKFERAWDGASPSERLKDWLDPAASGTLFVSGADPDGGANPGGDYDYFIAAIARTTGVGGAPWVSKMGLLNRSGATADVSLTYYGIGVPTTVSASLSNGVLGTWDDAVSTLFGVTDDSAGSVHVNSTQPLVVTARTYTFNNQGSFGSFMPGVMIMDGVSSGGTGLLSQLTGNTDFRTNIGLVNMADKRCRARVTLFSSTGAQVGTALERAIDAGSFKQINDVFAAAGAGNQNDAYATVEVVTSDCEMWAYAAVIDGTAGSPGTDDPTTVPLTIVQ